MQIAGITRVPMKTRRSHIDDIYATATLQLEIYIRRMVCLIAVGAHTGEYNKMDLENMLTLSRALIRRKVVSDTFTDVINIHFARLNLGSLKPTDTFIHRCTRL